MTREECKYSDPIQQTIYLDGFKNGKLEAKEEIINWIDNSEWDGEEINAVVEFIKKI